MRRSRIITRLDSLIESAFTSFAHDFCGDPWWRRERELINLFVFGHLAPKCQDGAILHNMTQIGIEAAVPQLKGRGDTRRRRDVCKDVVVWPEPKMTCWGSDGRPEHYPLSVLEWTTHNKHERGGSLPKRKKEKYAQDRKWLHCMAVRTMALEWPFVGYRVFVNQKVTPMVVSVDRFCGEESLPDWWKQ